LNPNSETRPTGVVSACHNVELGVGVTVTTDGCELLPPKVARKLAAKRFKRRNRRNRLRDRTTARTLTGRKRSATSCTAADRGTRIAPQGIRGQRPWIRISEHLRSGNWNRLLRVIEENIGAAKVCSGSKTVLAALKRDFRNTPNNGHQQTARAGPVRANSEVAAYSITSSALASTLRHLQNYGRASTLSALPAG
jgi:hypothetical protein